MNASRKAAYVTQSSDDNRWLYNKTFSNILMTSVRSLFLAWVLVRKFNFGVIEWHFLVLFVLKENSLIADIIDQELRKIILCIWLVDARDVRQQRLQSISRDISVTYILIYKKNGNFLIVPPNSLNDVLGVSSTSKLIPQTLETMNRQSVLQELEKTESKISNLPGQRESQSKQ